MTTPHRPSSKIFESPGPSALFLRQLLDEISGTSTPRAVRSRTLQQSSRRSEPGRRRSERRPPSVWVGGTFAAQDARHKLREADEARSKKPNTPNAEDTSASRSLSPHELIPPSQATSVSSGGGDLQITQPDEGRVIARDKDIAVHEGGLDGPPSQQSRPKLDRLEIPEPVSLSDGIARANSPLLFCDSDISSTPSPSDPPTSALSVSSTNATTVQSHPDSRPASPRKRERSPDAAEFFTTSKKMRSMTMPEPRNMIVTPDNQPHLMLPLRGISGDNRRVVRNSAFIERVAAPLLTDDPTHQQLPELSSFRPNLATKEGVAPVIASLSRTPRQPSTQRRPSASPEPPETPSFARSLHLFDASVAVRSDGLGNEWTHDISIYKNIHGEEWRRNSLCKHCFRRSGQFSRIMTYGYESCGRDEELDSHYWEHTVNPNY